jgi:hypothetical protein
MISDGLCFQRRSHPDALPRFSCCNMRVSMQHTPCTHAATVSPTSGSSTAADVPILPIAIATVRPQLLAQRVLDQHVCRLKNTKYLLGAGPAGRSCGMVIAAGGPL